MASPYGPDLNAALSSGIGNAMGVAQLRGLKSDNQRQEVLRANAPQAIEGNPDALRSVMTADPEAGMKIQTFIQNADKAKLEKAQMTADNIARMSTLVLNAPDQELPDAYAWALNNAEKMGIDISAAPRTRDPQVIRQYLKAMQAQAISFKDQMPTMETIYEGGQAQKAMVNPMTGEVTKRVGGPKAERGTSLTVNPETGEISFYEGVNAQGAFSGLGKAAENKVEGDILNATEMLARVNTIGSLFKPEYQTLQGKGEAAWLGLKAKSGGALGELSPDQEAYLADFADYRSTAVNNLNTILKELSGAAVNPHEYERIKAAMPNAGTGVFDGDDPITFKSKMDARLRDTKLAIARQTYHRTNGLSGDPWDTIALSEMPKKMAKREGELLEQVKSQNPQADDGAIRAQVRALMKQEFGL